MANSRTEKYKELRDSISDEVNLDRSKVVVEQVVENDDFLSFIPKKETEEINIDDTLKEVTTYELLKDENNEELNRALQSAKSNVGKEEFNTRMDILDKIRNPQKTIVQVENMDVRDTQEFVNGYFTNAQENVVESKPVEVEKTKPVETVKEPVVASVIPPKKISLMERLKAMSPQDDVLKAEEALNTYKTGEYSKEELSNTFGNTLIIEDLKTNEKIIEKNVKEKTKKDVKEKAKKQKNKPEIVETQATTTVTKVLNYVIVALLIVFLVLCVMITIQIIT